MDDIAKHRDALERIEELILTEVPDFKNVMKPEWFMEGVTTTLYPHVYWSEYVYNSPRAAWKILAHEYIHLLQAKRGPWKFLMIYAMPQLLGVLAAFSVLAVFGNLSWLWCLLALLFFAPLPAYWRMKYEMEAYAMSMAVNFWRYGFVTEDQLERIERIFTSPTYYYMWPFKRNARKRLEQLMHDVHSGYYNFLPGYREVRVIVEETWRPYR